MKDDDGIIPDSEYDPQNQVHNPALYVWAKQEAEREIAEAAKEIRNERIKALAKDKPGEFAGLSCAGWLVILAMCIFFIIALAS